MRRTTLLCCILIALGALGGFYGCWKRYETEGLNRRVELALEYAEIKTLAEMTSQPIQTVLAQFKDAGITSLAITEDTIGGLEAQGAIWRDKTDAIGTLIAGSPTTFDRIKRALLAKGLKPPTKIGPSTRFGLAVGLSQGERSFVVGADYATLRPLGVGLDPKAIAVAQAAGLFPVGRVSNFPGASLQTMTGVLSDLKRQGVQTVIFQGTDVLGFRGQYGEAAGAMRAAQVNYGQVEFGKQKGDEALARALQGEYVRVHSISEAEMETLDENEAIDRFVRAARERNIRLCYIRLLTSAGADPVGVNTEYIEKIARGIARGKEMEFGAAHAFRETGVPQWVFGLTAVGAVGGLTLLLLRLAPISGTAALLTLAALLLLCVGAAVGLGEMGRKVVALLAGLAFPTLACLRRDVLIPNPPAPFPGRGGGVRESSPTAMEDIPPFPFREGGLGGVGAAQRAIAGLAAASLVTFLGVVHVIGLLATRPFMLKADQFLGIKVAHALPVLFIGVLAIVGLPCLDRSWAEGYAPLKQRAARFFDEPVRIGMLLLSLVALIALALALARTGNEPGIGVSGVELKFRSIMDRVLPVRPRTKEFLLGHPAFVLALALWFRGRRRWALPLFVVGAIGQVSLLNTFCHIHTPLVLSLIRAVTSLVFGAILGVAAFWVVERLSRKT